MSSEALEPELLALIRMGVTSIWALEVLLLVKNEPERVWNEDEIVRELRASPTIVRDALARLGSRGAVRVRRDGITYAASGELERDISLLADAYRNRPLAVMKAIAEAPDARIRTFADAFRLRG